MFLKKFVRQKLKKNRKVSLISKKEHLQVLEAELKKSTLIGVDTEFDWRTTYFPKLSMIQICVNRSIFLIDCLSVNPKGVLVNYFENNNFLKIFHSARSDTTVLSKCLGINTVNVYDIQQADKKLSKGEIQAYGKIVKKFFNIRLSKAETNSNWLKRPLSTDQIRYAQEDVDYLLEIYSYQKKELIKLDLLEDVLEDSEKEAKLGNKPLKTLRFSKLQNKFSRIYKSIFLWREELAEEKNIPPAFIFKDKYIKILSKIELKGQSARKNIMTILGDTDLTESFISKFL